MRTKRSIGWLLIFAMLLSSITVFAAEGQEAIQNGSMETIGADGFPSAWSMVRATIGENFEVTKDAKTGNAAIRFYADKDSLHAVQTISNLVSGESYTVTAQLKQAKGTGAAIKIEFANAAGESISDKAVYQAFRDAGDAWTKVSVPFTMPSDAISAVLMVRLVGGGDVTWDDVSIVGKLGGGSVTGKPVTPAATPAPTATPVPTSTPAPVETDKIMIAPTVELREGTAYSVAERERIDFPFNGVTGTAATKAVGEHGDAEIIMNGSFEYKTGAAFSNWGVVSGTLDEKGAFVETADVKDGKQALRFTSDANVHIVQGTTKCTAGEYELSAWCKRVSETGTPVISLMVYYKNPSDGFSLEAKSRPTLTFADAPVGEWVFRTFKFTMPAEVTQVSILTRLMGAGDVIFDKISLIGPAREEVLDPMPEYIPPAEGVENLLYDPGFEMNSFEYIAQAEERLNVWFSRSNTFGGFWGISSDEAHSGNSSMRLKFEASTSMPWVGQIVPVTPGQEYQFSAWVKVGEGSQSWMRLQADAYSGVQQTSETYIKDGQAKNDPFVIDKFNTEWQHVTTRFTPYPGTTHYALLLRAGSEYPYEMYIDDVEFFPIRTANEVMHMLETDEVFYYSDWTGNGRANVSTYVDRKPELAGAPMRFRLLDGESVLKEEVVTLTPEGTGEFFYDLDLLAEKKKEYKVEARLLNSDGTPTENFLERIIYKYDRPTLLDENMKFMTNGGKVINYVLAQGSVEEVMYRVGETGATVGRAIGSGRTTLLEKLDIAQANGMMATVTLFNHEDIRDPAVREKVIETINIAKDHPALFGWYLWEEPSFSGDNIDLDENIRIGTKLIRDMDPDHPIGSVISEDDYYGRLVTYNDWMDLDCYPAQAYDGRTQYIADNMAHAMEVSNWQKNMSIMIQAFEWFEYKPTWDEMRSFIYQCFFEGSSGFSFHTFGKEGSTAEDGTAVLVGDEHWNAMVDSQWEYDFMFDHFVNEKYPLFNEARTPGVRWRLAVVDDALYAIVLNMNDTETNHIDFKLQSYDGKVTVNGFTAELLAGGEKTTLTGDGDTLSLDVPGFGALLYKITPNTPTDFSGVKGSRFRDLYNHVWAREAIINLDEAGIVNDKSAIAYGAKDNITRGDYAMFLVRTLGLASDSTENFADVKPHAEYAKELAIGKATGILQGVGDNKFNPTAQITRQDMMTMTSRAMQLSGTADLARFSDSGSIADYAAAHVAAMVAEGLIQGNADGTINPLGNTTRAEAAVIMYRILGR